MAGPNVWDQFQPYHPPEPEVAAQPAEPLTGEDYLKSLNDPGRANMIRAYVEGRAIPVGNARSPQVQSVKQQAAIAFPNFDETLFKSRNETRKDFASGTSAKNITSLGTVMGHLNDLVDTSQHLAQHDLTPLNTVQNYVTDKIGQPQYKDFNLTKQAVADEMAKVFRGSGMSEAETERWLQTFDSSSSPDQFKGVIGRGLKLLDSRMTELANQYNRGMQITAGGLAKHTLEAVDDEGRRIALPVSEQGLRAQDLLSAEAKAKVGNIKKWLYPASQAGAGAQVAATAPAGGAPPAAASAADGWTTLPGGIRIREKQ